MMPTIAPPSTTGRAPMRLPPSVATASPSRSPEVMVATSAPLPRSTAAMVIAPLLVTCRLPLLLWSGAVKGDAMSNHEHEPILRVMPGPADINANGHIFGGWVLSQMDIAAGIVASRRAKGSVATVEIEAMKFIEQIHLRDLFSVYATVERVGQNTMAVW